MEKHLHFWLAHWQEWIALPALLFVAIVIAGFTIRFLITKFLAKWAQKTDSPYDDVLIDAVRLITLKLTGIAALYCTIEYAPWGEKLLRFAYPVLSGLAIFVVAQAIAFILVTIIKIRSERAESPIATTSLIRRIVVGTVYVMGGITILRGFGVEIGPVLTALGVGGLAVALALQDTLANMFAGIYITLAKQVRVGDFIKLDTGFEGYVTDIGWRNTTMKTPEENMIIIPNNKLSQAIVTNFFLPESTVLIKLQVGVSHDSDTDQVEEILLSVVQQAGYDNHGSADTPTEAGGKIQGVLLEPKPFVRFAAIGESNLQFVLNVMVTKFDYQFEARHNLMKRVHRALRENNIEIPYPMRTIVTRTPSDIKQAGD
jgi:small-conductance mechanosensitive channel